MSGVPGMQVQPVEQPLELVRGRAGLNDEAMGPPSERRMGSEWDQGAPQHKGPGGGNRRSPGLCVERVRGIEPPLRAWEARVLPLNYTRGNRR